MARGWMLTIAVLACAAPALARDPPLALVESVADAPAAGVEAFDYLYPGDQVDLRPGGALRIAYFRACVVDSFQGGVVRASKDGARVRGGKSNRAARPCQTAALVAAGDGREAGVAVKRVTPFQGQGWRELAVATAQPTFIWPKPAAAGETKVAVYFLDAAPKTLVWSGATEARRIAYPADAPPLAPGMPYEVSVETPGGGRFSMVFSVDAGIDPVDGVLNTAVPLGL
jgi:hypothetical protein